MNLLNHKFPPGFREGRARYPHRAAKGRNDVLGMLLLICIYAALVSALTGCKTFRPVADMTHYYVLSALAKAPAETQSRRDLNIGIAPVEIPSYLQNSRIIVRRGANEIYYSEFHQWGEHLDKGIQRAVAGNLSILLPGTRAITSAWQSNDVKAEVYVSIQRFELDENGDVTLDCQWRILSPEGTRVLHSNRFVTSKKGPSLAKDPTGAVSTLSEALAGLSKEIAAALTGL